MRTSDIVAWFVDLGIPPEVIYEADQTMIKVGDGKVRVTQRGSMLRIEFPTTTQFISEAPGIEGFKNKFVAGLLQEPYLFNEPAKVRYIPDKQGGRYQCSGSFGSCNVKLHNDRIINLDTGMMSPLGTILRNYLKEINMTNQNLMRVQDVDCLGDAPTPGKRKKLDLVIDLTSRLSNLNYKVTVKDRHITVTSRSFSITLKAGRHRVKHEDGEKFYNVSEAVNFILIEHIKRITNRSILGVRFFDVIKSTARKIKIKLTNVGDIINIKVDPRTGIVSTDMGSERFSIHDVEGITAQLGRNYNTFSVVTKQGQVIHSRSSAARRDVVQGTSKSIPIRTLKDEIVTVNSADIVHVGFSWK